MQPRRLARGELREAVLQTSLELLAEAGTASFSVAEVARRLGASTAAPYRHFADRDHLLAAVATVIGQELATAIREAVEQAGADPAHRFCAATGAYTRFAAVRGVGFNVIFAAGMERLHEEALIAAGREVMGTFRIAAEDTGNRPVQDSLHLVEAQVALAHGYATL